MPRKSAKPKAWPIVVKIGSAEAKIYRHEKHGGDRFILNYYEGSARKQKWFSDLGVARAEADAAVAKIATWQIAALQLTGADRESYVHAQLLLNPLGMPLHAAIEEYVKARNVLDQHPLLGAVEDFAKRHRAKLPEISVEDLVSDGLKAKRQDGMSEKYLIQLSSDWGKFQKAFKKSIHMVTTVEMEEWMRGLKVSGRTPIAARTRNNLRTAIITLFSFARQRGYLPKGLPTEAEGLSKAKVRDGEIVIFSADQISTLLKNATKRMIPFIALGAFAGLRSAEIHRLSWDAIRFDDDLIEIKAGQAKTASRRLVPLEPNLKAWLFWARGKKRKGLIMEEPELWKDVTALGKTLQLGWPQNVLRHSYISYRVARDKDVNKVALDSGNSTQIIFKHYRELAMEKQANAWFEVDPVSAKLKR